MADNPTATDGVPSKKDTTVTVVAETGIIPNARRSVEVDPVTTSPTLSPATTSVTMVEPIAGFDADTYFTLSPIDEAGYLQSLRSVRDPELRFVISPAEVFFAAYRDSLVPIVTAPVADVLATADDPAAQQMYLMLTIGNSLADTTANLRAPLVVDKNTGRAIQVILDDDTFPLRQPLPTE